MTTLSQCEGVGFPKPSTEVWTGWIERFNVAGDDQANESKDKETSTGDQVVAQSSGTLAWDDFGSDASECRES